MSDKWAALNDLNMEGCRSITNDADWVVAKVLMLRGKDGPVPEDFRIVYEDSTGMWDELIHDGKRFLRYGLIQASNMSDALAAIGVK